MSYLGDEELSKDIVHDVFAEVWKKRATIDFSQPLYSYLVCLVRNRCLNYLEHKKVEGKYIECQLLFSDHYDTYSDTEQEEILNKIITRIDKLPNRSREILRLYFLERKKYKEIAVELNISINTVKTHMSSGIRILRNEFSEQIVLLFLK